MRRFAVVVIAVAVSVSGCSLFSSSEDTSPPQFDAASPVKEQTVDVSPDATTEVSVSDNWTISIPRGGSAASDSTFTVRPAEGSDEAGKSVIPLAGADLTLSTGQPTAPLTFRYELDEPPLPEGTDLYLLGRESGASDSVVPATPIAAAIDSNRRVATAQVPHLSTWEWLAVEANHFVTSTLGLRGSAPECKTQPRPGWLDEVVFLDEKEAPMRICTGADPADENIAVVKIRNNRGIGMIVTAPVTPRWAHLDVFSGQPANVAAEIESATISLLGVPTSVRSRTWVLPPGGGVDIGFTASSLPLISKITATATLSTVIYGVLWDQLEDRIGDPLTLSAMELGFMAACFGQAVDSGLAGMSDSQVRAAATGFAAVAMCLIQKAPDVLSEIAGHLSEKAFQQMQSRKIAEKVGRNHARYLPLLNRVTTALVLADAVATVNLGAGAWEIGLFKKVDPEYSLNAACGRIDDRRTVTHPSLGAVTIGLRHGRTVSPERAASSRSIPRASGCLCRPSPCTEMHSTSPTPSPMRPRTFSSRTTRAATTASSLSSRLPPATQTSVGRRAGWPTRAQRTPITPRRSSAPPAPTVATRSRLSPMTANQTARAAPSPPRSSAGTVGGTSSSAETDRHLRGGCAGAGP